MLPAGTINPWVDDDGHRPMQNREDFDTSNFGT